MNRPLVTLNWFAAVALSTGAAFATEGPAARVTITNPATGHPTCAVEGTLTVGSDVPVFVKDDKGNSVALGYGVTIAAGKTTVKLAAKKKSAMLHNIAAVAEVTVTADDATITTCTASAPQQPAPQDERPNQKTDEAPLPASDADEARLYLRSEGITLHTVTGGPLGRTIHLYHLPDGTPAFALPAHINEKDRLVLETIVPVGTAVAYEISKCEDVPTFRIEGSYAAASALATTPKLKAGGWISKPDTVERQCAGTLAYKITVGGEKGLSAVTSIPIDPVYHLSWGAAIAFDFGRPRRLGLADRPGAAGTTEKAIKETDDYTGFRPLVTLGLHPCGANPKDWRPCDWVAPFVGVDPSALKEGFVLGVGVLPAAGLGLLAGVSVFKSEVLKSEFGLRPNDVYTQAGDLPKTNAYNRDSLGVFVAATITRGILDTLDSK